MIKRFSAVQIAMLLTGSIAIIGGVTIIIVANNNNANNDDPTLPNPPSTPHPPPLTLDDTLDLNHVAGAESLSQRFNADITDNNFFTPYPKTPHYIRFDASSFCSVQPNNQKVQCNRMVRGHWELFTFEPSRQVPMWEEGWVFRSDRVFVIKGPHGKYCRAQDNRFTCDLDTNQIWEPETRFTITPVDNENYSNRYYMSTTNLIKNNGVVVGLGKPKDHCNYVDTYPYLSCTAQNQRAMIIIEEKVSDSEMEHQGYRYGDIYDIYGYGASDILGLGVGF